MFIKTFPEKDMMADIVDKTLKQLSNNNSIHIFSNEHGSFSRVDSMLSHKVSLNRS